MAIRVLIAKPGLDGHDKGAKTVAVALKNAGMEVVYTGRRQSVDQIVITAIQEGVDVIGLSILSGVHIEITEQLMEKMKEKKLETIPVVVGGVIPHQDRAVLKRMGVREVFPIGSTFEEIVQGITKIAKEGNRR
ncbi:MAG: cobalamin B12-binding domain-containing protein [Deltaproteobacteria bacterium]|nr:cobalamin B12-binding domain-containing protein [Deltaproteobacteria bacterium]MBM4323900.1 cobalamin B12-binding domain-containing protein [Deltaproteobacteria bacterium]MBM4347321.1 cobalamin B12-binding domain-containing protein [Deltaproteobacteria bacterium]